MARYTEAVCRLCRRETATSKTGEKIKLFLKGDRCLSKKCAVERRGTAPGQKTQNTKTRQKISEYGRQLREKQFSNYFRQAQRVKGQTGATFLQFLERRLDNVIYRLNLGQSRAQARQLVTHRHFRLNGRIVNVPSIIVKAGDVISIADGSKSSDLFTQLIETAKNRRHPEWLEFNETDATAKVLALPSREQIDTPVDEQLIVEYYSR
jgi:small subunit ribosomal protein S4